MIRTCHCCQAIDRLLPIVGGGIEHFVKPEWIPLDRQDDEKELRRYLLKGWAKKVLDGRLGVEHFTCTNCLNANALRDSIWSELKAKARSLEAKQNKGDEYYRSLVEEWT